MEYLEPLNCRAKIEVNDYSIQPSTTSVMLSCGTRLDKFKFKSSRISRVLKSRQIKNKSTSLNLRTIRVLITDQKI